MSIEQLARVSLALVMNHRPIPSGLTSVLFTQVLSKLDKAQSKDAFYICMALGRGLGKKIDESQIVNFSDLMYSLYISVARSIKEYDLQQLA